MSKDLEGDSSARVTTRTGDDGYTSLLGPDRVPKYSSRPNAFGTLDEASAALGLARALITDPMVVALILEMQMGLYKLMAELATPVENQEKVPFAMEETDVLRLDAISTELKLQVEIGKRFIVPGGTVGGAALDVGRTIVRRGERLVAQMFHEGEVPNQYALEWLNRLSDAIFILARYVERDLPA